MVGYEVCPQCGGNWGDQEKAEDTLYCDTCGAKLVDGVLDLSDYEDEDTFTVKSCDLFQADEDPKKVAVNSNGVNSKIKVAALEDSKMRALGFTDSRDGFW